MTWLEQLVREFYEVQGYWVRTNVKYGPTGHGGYIGEADVLAFDPKERILVHIEPSMGSQSWQEKRKIFKRKFDKAAPYYFDMFDVPIQGMKRIAIAGWSLAPVKIEIPGVEIMKVSHFVQQVMTLVAEKYKGNQSPPEQFPLLRTLYFAKRFEKRT